MTEPLPVLLMARELDLGGCERDLTRLAKELDGSRFEPHVGCFRSGGFRFEELKLAGIPVTCFSVQSLIKMSGIRGAVAMRAYLRRHRIGLIHCFDAPTSVFAAPVSLSARVPMVARARCIRFGTVLRNHSCAVVDRLADAIIVNSNAVREDLKQEGVSPDRIHLCYNGVDTKVFCPRDNPRPPAVRDAPLVVGCVSVLRAEKRLDRLVEEFASVRSCLPGIRLLIVGSGEMLPSLQALSHKLGLEGVCIFEPATNDVAKWMRAMDIFVLPSDTESFPNVLLEAMACGCAVIGSRVGGIPELIEEGRSGLLFDTRGPGGLARALTTLIQDPGLRSRLGGSATERACACFSLEDSVRCIEAVYEKLLSGRRYPGK